MENNILEKEYNGIKYLEFKVLTDLGIKNMYTLKPSDFSNSKLNEEKQSNYNKVLEFFNVDVKHLIKPYQAHTDNVEIVDEKRELENTDGVITKNKELVLCTNNADCILIIVYDKNKKILANIHSGWRGTLKRILEKTLNKMKKEFNSKPSDIHIVISPSIRNCHFEVEKDVEILFEEEFKEIEDKEYIVKNGNKYYIDTVYLNKKMAEKFGIPKNNIYDCNICSVCNNDKVHSYRKNDNETKYMRNAFFVKMD